MREPQSFFSDPLPQDGTSQSEGLEPLGYQEICSTSDA